MLCITILAVLLASLLGCSSNNATVADTGMGIDTGTDARSDASVGGPFCSPNECVREGEDCRERCTPAASTPTCAEREGFGWAVACAEEAMPYYGTGGCGCTASPTVRAIATCENSAVACPAGRGNPVCVYIPKSECGKLHFATLSSDCSTNGRALNHLPYCE